MLLVVIDICISYLYMYTKYFEANNVKTHYSKLKWKKYYRFQTKNILFIYRQLLLEDISYTMMFFCPTYCLKLVFLVDKKGPSVIKVFTLWPSFSFKPFGSPIHTSTKNPWHLIKKKTHSKQTLLQLKQCECQF